MSGEGNEGGQQAAADSRPAVANSGGGGGKEEGAATGVMMMVSLPYRSNPPTDVLASSDIGAQLIKKNLLQKSGQ